MSDTPSSPPITPATGERIAKVIARSGRASRREAERMIAEGRVAVNGAVIYRCALNVTRRDRVTVDGAPLSPPEPPRLWLYHKPTGLVTTTRDEAGRPTIFDGLPRDLPRLHSVGRLDLNSEGLLLLTNDGALKRRLELPATGWLRRYRVRVNGRPTDAALAPLRAGLEIDGQRFLPMEVVLDRQQGANAWLTVGLREGKNREIRRAMADLGLTVNRLIRISFGPFQLGELPAGALRELRPAILRDQLGLEIDTERPAARRVARMTPPRPGRPSAPRAGSGTASEHAESGREGPRPGHGRKPGASARPAPAQRHGTKDRRAAAAAADPSRPPREGARKARKDKTASAPASAPPRRPDRGPDRDRPPRRDRPAKPARKGKPKEARDGGTREARDRPRGRENPGTASTGKPPLSGRSGRGPGTPPGRRSTTPNKAGRTLGTGDGGHRARDRASDPKRAQKPGDQAAGAGPGGGGKPARKGAPGAKGRSARTTPGPHARGGPRTSKDRPRRPDGARD